MSNIAIPNPLKRTEINAKIALARSQIEGLVAYAEANYSVSCTEAKALLARVDKGDKISDYLHKLSDLVTMRDHLTEVIHNAALEDAKHFTELSGRVDNFVLPK
jgi:hypothetical protein